MKLTNNHRTCKKGRKEIREGGRGREDRKGEGDKRGRERERRQEGRGREEREGEGERREGGRITCCSRS